MEYPRQQSVPAPWYAFEIQVSSCSWERRKTLVFLRDQMVEVQVWRYAGFYAGLISILCTNLCLTLGLGISCDMYVLVCFPWLGAILGICIAWHLNKPRYAYMCVIMRKDPTLWNDMERASEDDPVLRPVFENLRRKLVQTTS